MKAFFDVTRRLSFTQRVLTDVTNTASKVKFKKFDPTYTTLSTEEVTAKIELLTQRLPTGSDIIYRGTEGTPEIECIMRTDRMGQSISQSRKAPTTDIARYVDDNNSRFYHSYSPCRETVKPYAAGLSIVPCRGYIIVSGLPKVFTVPHKLSYLNEDMFLRYAKWKIDSMSSDDTTGHRGILEMTRGNNEFTAILGTSAQDDWRIVASDEVHSVFEVCGPGRLLSKFIASSELAYIRDWQNEGFSRRIYAIETVIYDEITHPHELESMNEKAREMGLIGPDERLITLSDASAVMNSGELDQLNLLYTTTETMRFSSVPKSIAIGDKDALVAYMTEQLQSSPLLMEREAAQSRVILE